MLLTLRVTGAHAADLEALLDKCPDELHSARLPFGVAHVFYPEVSVDAVTVALLVDIPAVAWSSNESRVGFSEPNAATNSFAIAHVFRSALAARSPRRPDLVTHVLPIEAQIDSFVVPRGTNEARTFFEPLGYQVQITEHVADEPGDHHPNLIRQSVRLTKQCPLYEVLSHIYVLGPVVDGHATDGVLDGERGALLMHAEGLVRGHPAGDRILQTYAARKPSEVALAFDRLAQTDPLPGQTAVDEPLAPTLLDDARADAIALELREAAAHSVVDLGCGDGKLLARLVREKALTRIVGFDVSHRLLEAAAQRMKLDRRGGKKSERLELLQGSLFYSDGRLNGFDAAVLADVLQHVPTNRLRDAENVVFHDTRPSTVVVMMNDVRREENASNEAVQGWTMQRFDAWATNVSERHGYRVRLLSPGSSSQTTRMAVFSR
ncbi:MAG TPA: methyltransferase [Polyangium sp.]|nr:methyltransferase [Polyangium sp.]